MTILSPFFNFVFCIEPIWKNLKSLKRTHMEKYIEYLHDNSNKSKRPNSHPEMYVNKSLSIIQKFLEDIQRYEYDMAPENHVRLLIFPEDKPKLRKNQTTKLTIFPTMY